MTLQEFWDAAHGTEELLVPIKGDCMAGRDIEDGDIVCVNLTKRPRPPLYPKQHGIRRQGDICICYGYRERTPRGPHIVQCKEYIGQLDHMVMVGTKHRFTGELCDYAFEPLAILGVVSACYSPDMTLKWEKDLSDCPATLGDVEDQMTSEFTVMRHHGATKQVAVR